MMLAKTKNDEGHRGKMSNTIPSLLSKASMRFKIKYGIMRNNETLRTVCKRWRPMCAKERDNMCEVPSKVHTSCVRDLGMGTHGMRGVASKCKGLMRGFYRVKSNTMPCVQARLAYALITHAYIIESRCHAHHL